MIEKNNSKYIKTKESIHKLDSNMTLRTVKCKWNKTLKDCMKNTNNRPCGKDSICELQYFSNKR